MEQYFQHLKTCNTMQDWSEAQEALSLCPEGADKAAAYEEMAGKLAQCTCGMEEALKAFKRQQEHYSAAKSTLDMALVKLYQLKGAGILNPQTKAIAENLHAEVKKTLLRIG